MTETVKTVVKYMAAKLDHEEATRRKTRTFWDQRDDGDLRDTYLAALAMERRLAGILSDLRKRLVALGVDPADLEAPEEPTAERERPLPSTPLEKEIESARDGGDMAHLTELLDQFDEQVRANLRKTEKHVEEEFVGEGP